MAMSNAEKCLSHTKSGHFLKKKTWSSSAETFKKKKNQAFSLKHYGRMVHKDIVNSVIGCHPVSSRLITVRLRANPFNITIIQVYALTSSYDDTEVDEFYRELQSLVDQMPKQATLVVQGDWNAKVGEDAQEDCREICGPFCNPETIDRGLKFIDFATYNNFVLANTLGNRNPSRRWT